MSDLTNERVRQRKLLPIPHGEAGILCEQWLGGGDWIIFIPTLGVYLGPFGRKAALQEAAARGIVIQEMDST